MLEVLILVDILFIPFSIGKILSSASLNIIYEGLIKPDLYTGTIGQQWLCGVFILFILAIIVAVVYGIIAFNWNWAKNRAERKMEKEEGDK